MKQEANPLHQARVLGTLIKLAGGIGEVNLDHADELWQLGVHEDDLWNLGQAGFISFDSVGEDGFKSITLCWVTAQTHAQLLIALEKTLEENSAALAKATGENNALQARVESLLQHDPEKLRREIAESEQHIKRAREQIAGNRILAPLSEPLDAIAAHFSSISRVADNYDDVYSNILKPMQDEGRRGIRATVKWAVIGILASWAVSNYAVIKAFALALASAG